MVARRYPIGSHVLPEGTSFRVWAPDHRQVTVVLEDGAEQVMNREDGGYFSCVVPQAKPCMNYRYRLSGPDLYPDPASWFQPQGPHGPSQICELGAFQWTDYEWRGRELSGTVIYELHIGTFTRDGTWAAAEQQLTELSELGINCIELMPVADFPGNFGWGYDGVNLFAPTRLYGTPDDFRRFVNSAHAHGIAVILDVVYNHLGPDGNYLGNFAQFYFTDRYQTDWGAAINFDGEQSAPVREFILTNAAYWIREFHLDGLRLDATQNIYDDSPNELHILTQITAAARAAAPGRRILIIAENEPQQPRLCRAVAGGGHAMNAVWNDDYHHSAMVALTGHNEAYYTDYLGNPQEFISAAKYGYLYQGQWYSWQNERRGEPGLDLPPSAYVTFLQNHDQVANSGRGLRAHQLSSPARYRALLALTLLMPGTPMLFQGQEFAASSPFLYFADHVAELAVLVETGRTTFLCQFPSLCHRDMIAQFASPHDPDTFLRCKLDFSERETHAAEYQLTKDCLKLRRSSPGFQPTSPRSIDGAVVGPQAFVLRYFFGHGQDRLVVVNLGHVLELAVVPEPLLAPPPGMCWKPALSTEDPRYGGNGVSIPDRDHHGWFIPAESTIVLYGEPLADAPAKTALKSHSTLPNRDSNRRSQSSASVVEYP